MRKTKKAIASLAIAGMVLSMAPMSVFGATTTNRLGGAGRVETAIQIAAQGWTASDSVIVVPADDANVVDALAAAPLAGQLNAPILVTYKGTLDPQVQAEIVKLGAKNVYAVGALSADTVASLKAISGVTVTTLQGADRTETAAKVAAQLTGVKGSFVVAYDGKADALSAASFAAANDYSIVIANPDGTIPASETVVAPTYTVGGQVSYAGATALAGADRYATNNKVVDGLTFNFDKVYVANGQTLVDALAGAPLAAQTNSPIVLGDAVGVATGANDNMKTNSQVIALGGVGAVSDSVLAKVAYKAPATLAVESVNAINGKTVEVKFNKEVDKASAETATYNFKAASTDAKTVTVSDVELQDDGVTVKLTLSAYLNKKADALYSVNIKGVRDLNDIEIAEYTDVVGLYDNEAPTVTEVAVADSSTIKVTFSEPMTATNSSIASGLTVKLAGVKRTIPASAISFDTEDEDNFTIDVVTAGLTHDKDYAITVEDLTDFAGNALTKYEGSFTYAEDTTDPEVVSVESLDLDTIKVVFSEKLKANSPKFVLKVQSDATQTTGFTINNFSSSSPDGKTFYVTGITGMEDGEQGIVTISQYQDLVSNPSNKSASSFTQTVTFNEAAPVLTDTTAVVKKYADNYYAVFTFDRNIVRGAGTILGKYVDSDSVTHSGYNFDAASTSAVKTATEIASLEKNQIALAINGLPSGTFTLTIPLGAVEDKYGNDFEKVTNAKFTFNQDVVEQQVIGVMKSSDTVESSSMASNDGYFTGTSNPKGAPITTDGNTVYVHFSGDVSADALDVSHYTIDGAQVFEKAIFDNAQSLVKLTLKNGGISTSGTKEFAISGISGVEDVTFFENEAAKNANGGDYFLNSAWVENETPTLDSVKLTSLSTLQLVFSEDMGVGATTLANYQLKVNGTAVATDDYGVVESNGTVTITLDNPVSVANSDKVTVKINKDLIKDVNSNNFAGTVDPITATVDFQDLEAQAKVAIDAAFDLINPATGYLKTGESAADLINAVNDAIDALDAAGFTTDSVNTYASNGVTKTYQDWATYLTAAKDNAASL